MEDPGQVRYERPYVPVKAPPSDWPLIDNDPHFKRVIRYARRSDWLTGGLAAAAGPGLLCLWERVAPSGVGRGGFAPILRLNLAIGLTGGFFILYTKSIMRFYGGAENKREVDMDMREMVNKVKKGEPLYGNSELTPYMQGVAARNSRYSGFLLHVIPWFNLVNHNQHGVDTAKYYQQAEKELAEEDAKKSQNQ